MSITNESVLFDADFVDHTSISVLSLWPCQLSLRQDIV